MQLAWSALARAKIRRGEHEAACAIVERWCATPHLPTLDSIETEPALRQKLARNPAHFGAAFALATRLRDVGDLPGAIAVLKPCASRENAPPYFHFLLHRWHAERRAWSDAAAEWTRYDDMTCQLAAK